MRPSLFGRVGFILILLAASTSLSAQESTAGAEAQELLQQGELQKAARVCVTWLREHPRDVPILLLLGQIQFSMAERIEAADRHPLDSLRAFRAAGSTLLRAESADPTALGSGHHHALGFIFMRESQYDGAIRHFSRALEMAPSSSNLYMFRGRCRLQKGDFAGAEKDLKDAMVRGPDNFHAQRYLAEALFLGGKTVDARQSLQSFYDVHGERLEIRRRLQLLYDVFKYGLAENDLPLARTALETGLELDPKSPEFLLELGVVQFRQGELKTSAVTLDRLLEQEEVLNPRQRLEAHHRRGNVAQQLGDHELAGKHFEKALAISPNHVPSLQSFGATLRRLGQKERARQVLTRFKELVPLEERVKRLQKMIRINPENHNARVQLITLFLEMDRTPEATVEFRGLRKRAPTHPALESLGEQLAAKRAKR